MDPEDLPSAHSPRFSAPGLAINASVLPNPALGLPRVPHVLDEAAPAKPSRARALALALLFGAVWFAVAFPAPARWPLDALARVANHWKVPPAMLLALLTSLAVVALAGALRNPASANAAAIRLAPPATAPDTLDQSAAPELAAYAAPPAVAAKADWLLRASLLVLGFTLAATVAIWHIESQAPPPERTYCAL